MTIARMTCRRAAAADAEAIAGMNLALIEDETEDDPRWGRNGEAPSRSMLRPPPDGTPERKRELARTAQRIRGWLLAGEYTAHLFELDGQTVAYALHQERGDTVYLRQFFVVRDRRREGIGAQAFVHLRREIWPAERRLSVSVLAYNRPAVAFWRAMGFSDFALVMEMPSQG